jgi:hypothetical protein
MDSEPVRTLARPLVSEPAIDREAVKDLSSELLSVRPEVELRELNKDLKSEVLSARPDAKDREALNALARPLT